MFSTYLVARRDYLGYVTAWGFWLGLLFTPVIMGVFMFAPILAEQAQPTRYFSVLETGNAFSKAMAVELDAGDARQARNLVDPIAIAQNKDSEKLKLFDQARDNGATTLEAVEAAGGQQVTLPQNNTN